jgi:hypothetical protein
MRRDTMLAAVAAGLLGAVGLTGPASAWGWDPTRAPEQPLHERVINHYIYKPHYKHVYHQAPHGDPYAYRYVRRSYYPYYASGYWVDADQMRNRYRYQYHGPKYRYQPSWGAPREHAHEQPAARPVK